MKNLTENQTIVVLVREFESICIDLATHAREVKYEEYEQARSNLISEPIIKSAIPEWIFKNRYGSQFWQLMKSKFPHYAQRREFIWNSMGEILQFIENGASGPSALSFKEIKDLVENTEIESLWRKVQLRKEKDPEGAITAARSMLESTIKYILEQMKVSYSEKEDINELYKKIAKELNMSPGNQSELIFKQILQGITSVVMGFSSLRNKYGDAHGKGGTYNKPSNRHADLVINLSGAMCTFLIDTFSVQNKNKNL